MVSSLFRNGAESSFSTDMAVITVLPCVVAQHDSTPYFKRFHGTFITNTQCAAQTPFVLNR